MSKYQDLLNILARNKDKPMDPNGEDFKKISDALKEISRVLKEKETVDKAKATSVQDIVDRLKFDQETLQMQKDSILEEGEFIRKREAIIGNHLKLLKIKLDLAIQSKDLNEEEIKQLKEKFKVLTKEKKAVNAEREMLAKGEQVTKRMIEMTTGISTNFMGPKGVIGSIKGFGKGLKETATAGNILATVMTKIFDAFNMADKAAAGIFKATGQDYLKGQISDLQNRMALDYGPQTGQALQDVATELMSSQIQFNFVDKATQNETLEALAKYKRLGVSASAAIDFITFSRAAIDQGEDIKKQKKILGAMHLLAKKTDQSPERVFREMAQSLPILGRYGNTFPRHFAQLSIIAARANVDVQDLINLTESFDKSDSALKQAAKFNALLGGNFLNAAQLMSASPGERVKLIRDAVDRANEELGNIHPRVLRSLSRYMKVDVGMLQSLKRAELEDFAKQAEGVFADPPKNLDREIDQAKSAGETMDAILTKIGTAMFHLFSDIVPKVVDAVKFLFDAMKSFANFDFLFGSDEPPAPVKTDPYASGTMNLKELQEAESAAMEEGVDSSVFEEQLAMAEKLQSGELLNQSEVDLFTESADAELEMMNTLPGTVPLQALQQLQEAKSKMSEGILMDLLEQDDAAEKEKKRQQAEEYMKKMSEPATKHKYRLKSHRMYDSPAAMSTMKSTPLPGVAPVVSANFETSQEDTVLIGRLIKLKEKLNSYAEKQSNVSLTVGFDKIGEVVR